MTYKYKRRYPLIEAFQHDGSIDSAIKIANWINLQGDLARVIPPDDSENGYDKNFAYIRLLGSTPRNIISPSSWVVKMAETVFYTLSNEEFSLVYEPAPEEEPDAVQITETTERGTDGTSAYA